MRPSDEIVRNRESRLLIAGYTFGYTVHCLELFGSRAWMVAFLAFAATQSGSAFPWHAAGIAAVVQPGGSVRERAEAGPLAPGRR